MTRWTDIPEVSNGHRLSACITRGQYHQGDIIDILFFEKCEKSVAPLGIIHNYFKLQISAFFGYLELSEPGIIKEECINCTKSQV